MTQKPFVDLKAIADALSTDTNYPRLRPNLLKALVAQSCLTDLIMAQSCCDALDRLEPDPKNEMPELANDTALNALLQQGIMLYARATETSGRPDERGAIKLGPQNLPPDAVVNHDILIQHRNQVVAHVIKTEDVWHNQSVYLVPGDTAWTYLATTERRHIDGNLCAILIRQTPIALSTVMGIAKGHFNKVMRALAMGGFPIEVWGPHAVDPVSVFGSEKAVEAAAAIAFSGDVTTQYTTTTDLNGAR